MKNNHTPEIRFPGYTGDWDQRKLGDIFNILDGDRGKNYPGESDFNDDGATLFLDTGNVKKNGFDFSTKKYITKEKDESLRSGKLELHDFVLTSRGTLGNVAYYDEKTRNNNPSVRINSAMLILRPAMNNQVSDDYMAAVLRGNIIDTFMLTNHVGSAQPHITKRDFSKVSIGIPSILEEQTKIGSFFKRLDKTIALHQQELTTFKQTKQGFLQKMFPNEGESVPEVRFPGYTGDWEQRKLGNHAEILTGGTPKTQIKEYWEPREIPWMSSGEVNKKRLSSTDNMISTQGFENSSARWVKENSVLIALAGQGKTRGTVAINEIPLTTNQSIAAIVPKDELHFEFIFQNLEKRYEELRLISSGDGTRGGLNKQLISDVEIMSPSVEEQIKIGNFFKQLDDTIALHQRELDALKETKKAFLQKMFV